MKNVVQPRDLDITTFCNIHIIVTKMKSSIALIWSTNNLLMVGNNCMHMGREMRFPTMWYVRPAKAQTSLRIRADLSEPLLVA